jgi:tetratricopeptide (TPR) repeat protein
MSVAAVAQVPQGSPVQTAVQAYWSAQSEGRFEEMVARREEAREALKTEPPDDGQFAADVQSVAQVYQSVGMNERARSVLENGLARSTGQGETNETQVAILTALAQWWQTDRNLLNAVSYWEKAAAAIDSLPSVVAGSRTARARWLAPGAFQRVSWTQPHPGVLPQLAAAYIQVGRKADAARVLARQEKSLQAKPNELATFYDRQNRLVEAEALYKKQMEPATIAQSDAWAASVAAQQLANLYERQQRYSEAIGAYQQAMTTVPTSDAADRSAQTAWMRQNIARLLARAGQTGAADQAWQQLLEEAASGSPDVYRQTVVSYADQLSSTQRGEFAQELLTGYLNSQSSLGPSERSMVFYALSNATRSQGDNEKAADYQRAAEENNQQSLRSRLPNGSIQADVQKVQSLANSGNAEEAYGLALKVLDAASAAPDVEQAAFMVQNVAWALLAKQKAGQAEQLFRRLFSLAEQSSDVTLRPLLAAAQFYPNFLMGQEGRRTEAPAAIDRYRDLLIQANGTSTGMLSDVWRMKIQFAGSGPAAQDAARELLEFEESLNGKVSEPYLNALQTLAGMLEFTDTPQALELFHSMVPIADSIYPENHTAPLLTRTNVALALARHGEFDEADRMGREAGEIARRLTPPQPDLLTGPLEQIRQMKEASTQAARQ